MYCVPPYYLVTYLKQQLSFTRCYLALIYQHFKGIPSKHIAKSLELFTNSTTNSVGQHTKLSMFGKFLVHAWSSCEALNGEHSMLVNWGSNSNSILV